jgi:hypothetical protein
MDKIKICRLLEILRWTGVGAGIFFAFTFGKDPAQLFNILSLFVVISIAGFTGIESVFLGEASSQLSGYGEGGAYQRQSGFNNLAAAIAMILSFSLGWGLYAYAAVASVVLIFLSLSACNHAYSAIKEKNRNLKNMLRPLMTVLLLALMVPIMMNALRFARGV